MNWYLEVLKKYAVFSGRARRKEYWMFVLINLIIVFVLGLVIGLIENATNSNLSILVNVYQLAVLFPSIAVGVRRMHDTDHSGWWLLFPIVNLIFAVSEGTQGDNKYGSNPKAISQTAKETQKELKTTTREQVTNTANPKLAENITPGAGITPTKHDSPESVKGLLKAHIVRLNGMYRGKPGEQESLRFIQQVLNDDLLTFAVDQIAQKIPEALAEKKVLQSTGTFGEWFMAISICPWFKPEDVKANLGQEYMELLNRLAGPALNTPGGKNIAHWVYCSNGNQASVHLTMMPNPKGSF